MTTRLFVMNSRGMPWRGVPGCGRRSATRDGFLLLGPAQALEKAAAAAVGVGDVHVVEDDDLIVLFI
jgi:hypothetical protein